MNDNKSTELSQPTAPGMHYTACCTLADCTHGTNHEEQKIKNAKRWGVLKTNNILMSFSGGETSAFLLHWLIANYSDYNIKVVFANTGEENEETLEFVNKCSEHFNIEVIWLQYKRLSFEIVDFKTAYRSHNKSEIANKWQNHPFRAYISEFMIPNKQNMTCTRELKEYIINRYLTSMGWKPSTHTKCIGIRADEIDRIGKYWYPLVHLGITKPMVNTFWGKMPFRLNLKGYEGNCKTCWKKSFRKLVTIARNTPSWFDFMKQMEIEFGDYIKETQKHRLNAPMRFFRENKTVADIFEMAKDKNIKDATDDSKTQTELWYDGTELDISNGCTESCEVF
jgi:hypothetical protein